MKSEESLSNIIILKENGQKTCSCTTDSDSDIIFAAVRDDSLCLVVSKKLLHPVSALNGV